MYGAREKRAFAWIQINMAAIHAFLSGDPCDTTPMNTPTRESRLQVPDFKTSLIAY
jgi:hypothetical protein